MMINFLIICCDGSLVLYRELISLTQCHQKYWLLLSSEYVLWKQTQTTE